MRYTYRSHDVPAITPIAAFLRSPTSARSLSYQYTAHACARRALAAMLGCPAPLAQNRQNQHTDAPFLHSAACPLDSTPPIRVTDRGLKDAVRRAYSNQSDLKGEVHPLQGHPQYRLRHPGWKGSNRIRVKHPIHTHECATRSAWLLPCAYTIPINTSAIGLIDHRYQCIVVKIYNETPFLWGLVARQTSEFPLPLSPRTAKLRKVACIAWMALEL